MWKHKNFINLQLCAGNIVETTINWDSHITKVALGTDWEWTQSGQTDSQSGYTSLDFIVTLQDGYVIDTVTANNGFTVSNITDTTFHLNDGGQPLYEVTITITSKSSVQKLPTPTNVSITGTTVQWDEVANATSYDVLVDGEVWENVPQPSSGETWVLNETVDDSADFSYDVDFVSNEVEYQQISCNIMFGIIGYLPKGATNKTVAYKGGWQNQAYRTITFATSPTGDLLTWLQSNGTKQ